MAAIAKLFVRENGFLARAFTLLREQSRLAMEQHLQVCQVYAEAVARNHERR